ncbi:uncharacterized protein LOC144193141, partial [Stigmatopora nigra]
MFVQLQMFVGRIWTVFIRKRTFFWAPTQVVSRCRLMSFATLINKVNRALPVFNKVFTGRAEVLWQHVVKLRALAGHLATFHQKAKVAGVTAIAGLALAPFTFGASLIATAGGVRPASASISANVNIPDRPLSPPPDRRLFPLHPPLPPLPLPPLPPLPVPPLLPLPLPPLPLPLFFLFLLFLSLSLSLCFFLFARSLARSL